MCQLGQGHFFYGHWLNQCRRGRLERMMAEATDSSVSSVSRTQLLQINGSEFKRLIATEKLIGRLKMDFLGDRRVLMNGLMMSHLRDASSRFSDPHVLHCSTMQKFKPKPKPKLASRHVLLSLASTGMVSHEEMPRDYFLEGRTNSKQINQRMKLLKKKIQTLSAWEELKTGT